MFGRKRAREPQETTDTYQASREYMVEHQIRRRGIVDQRILHAMRTVPREEFLLGEQRSRAYDDSPLSIGFGQTISQPYTVAFQCDSLDLTGSERVLEIGTGCGYAAAVLSLLATEVHTVERIPGLADQARKTLQRLGYTNVYVHTTDGTLGLPDLAPFHAIEVAAGGTELPDPLVEQLALGGRIVVPLGRTLHEQSMFRFTKLPNELVSENLGAFSFVPLIGKHGWGEHATGE